MAEPGRAGKSTGNSPLQAVKKARPNNSNTSFMEQTDLRHNKHGLRASEDGGQDEARAAII